MAVRAVLFPLVTLSLVVFIGSCDKKPSDAPAPSASAPVPDNRSAAASLRGTWQVDTFAAAAPSGSTSAEQLAAMAQAEEAAAVRVVYTGDQVKIIVPGQPTLTSSYDVKEDSPTRVKLKSGKDDVIITFQDQDHMTIDRPGNAYGAKMSMKRVKDAPIPTATPKPPETPPVAMGSGSASGAYPLEMPKGTIMKVSPSGTVLIFPDGGQLKVGN